MSIQKPSKKELLHHLWSHWLTKQQATTMYDIIVDYIKSNIESGKSFRLTGLWTFYTYHSKDKMFFDFQTKTKKFNKAHKILKFKSSRAYNKSLNK